MPKYRQLHTKIIDSFDFNEMPDDFTRLFWVLLPLILDSEGRGIDNISWINSKMYPMRDIDPIQITGAMDWLADRAMIIQYEVNHHCYFYIPTFKNYQSRTDREASSILPCPPELVRNRSGEAEELCAVPVSASVSESESVNESRGNKKPDIFTLYEREMGIISPMIMEELVYAEKDYPIEWIECAFKEAATHNKRSWKYAQAILKRWKIDGFQNNGHKPGVKTATDAYGNILEVT